jgi:hypothetical protein
MPPPTNAPVLIHYPLTCHPYALHHYAKEYLPLALRAGALGLERRLVGMTVWVYVLTRFDGGSEIYQLDEIRHWAKELALPL